MLKEACARNNAWQDAGLAPIVVSVNVSARQFRQDNLVRTVAEVLEETGLAPRYLELKLTESMVMHDAAQLVAMIDARRDSDPAACFLRVRGTLLRSRMGAFIGYESHEL